MSYLCFYEKIKKIKPLKTSINKDYAKLTN